MTMPNTYKSGVLTFFAYPTEEGTFVAACKELCLVREGKDFEHVKLSIMADAKRYLHNVCDNHLGEHLLNQSLPEEIVKEFDAYRRKISNEFFEKWSEKIKELLEDGQKSCR